MLETGTISFCDKKALNIKSDDYKRYILEKLEKQHGVVLYKRNYQSYKPNHEKLVKRFGNSSMLSVVSSGNAYLLYITKDEYSGKNQVFFIDCKISEGYEYPRIIMLWLRFKKNVYKNTLFRGELVRDRDSNWIYLIDDLLVYCGRQMNKVKKVEKVRNTHDIFENSYCRDDRLELMTIRIKKYFTVDKTEDIKNKFIPSLNYDSRGIMLHLNNGMNLFVNTGGGRTRHTTKRRNIKSVKKEVKPKPTKDKISLSAGKSDYKTERHIAHSIKMTIEPIDTPERDTATLIIKDTDQPDVYKLYAKKGTVNKRVSYAHVPSIEISKMLRELFVSATGDILVQCKYNSVFNKWTPIKSTVGTVDTVSTVKMIKRSIK
tara:strand:- start:33 stop:1154 length:1122 start_codon:yes stop_codon:yes gene_type:complete